MMDLLAAIDPLTAHGRVTRVNSQELMVRGLRLSIGDAVDILGAQGPRRGQVVALGGDGATVMLYGSNAGLANGDLVARSHAGMHAVISGELVGRVLDAFGHPIDGGRPPAGVTCDIEAAAPSPLERQRIDEPLPIGVKAIDAFTTTGRGQRLGIFGGSGVGKSTLLGMMARGTVADVTVLALIGERGREVREFIEDELGPDGMSRCVVVVATSDQPALMRRRAALLATRIAEWFADEGADVLLMVDSLTRLAMAQREIGLAADEPPTARGYTPSVFSLMAELLERTGPRPAGTITGFYTVLVEGDDMNDPIADAARSVLDGHIVLDRRLAVAGRYPAIDPLASLSRLAPRLVSSEQAELVALARDALASADEVRDLVEVGAYVSGTNPGADRGLRATPHLVEFLRQSAEDSWSFDDTWAALAALAPVIRGGS